MSGPDARHHCIPHLSKNPKDNSSSSITLDGLVLRRLWRALYFSLL